MWWRGTRLTPRPSPLTLAQEIHAGTGEEVAIGAILEDNDNAIQNEKRVNGYS